jgi:hypothetical protein
MRQYKDPKTGEPARQNRLSASFAETKRAATHDPSSRTRRPSPPRWYSADRITPCLPQLIVRAPTRKMRGERREGFRDLDPDALVADAEEHMRRGGALGGWCVGGVSKMGAEDLQRREGVVHGRRARSGRRRTVGWVAILGCCCLRMF